MEMTTIKQLSSCISLAKKCKKLYYCNLDEQI